MAQRALPPGAIRRRSFFGLFDADGWTAAFIKALFWFALILILLGYIPDRAYYATVSPTIDVGYNAISPINLCDAGNGSLPCPPPPGAFVPWQASPPEVNLAAPRVGSSSVQSGESLYLVGGRAAGQPSADVVTTKVSTDGGLAPWTAGPALPAPRTNAAIASFTGVPYVIGGLDAEGKPTDTVIRGKIDKGVLTGWETVDALKLPVALSDASAAPTASGFYLIGGRTAAGIVPTVYRSILDTKSGALGAWQEQKALVLPEVRAGAPAIVSGKFLFVIGGEGPSGPTNNLYRLDIDTKGEPKTVTGTKAPLGWAEPAAGQDAQRLPAPRVSPMSYGANSALYIIGGTDASGAPVKTVYWAVPDPAAGTIPEWKHLDVMDLPQPRRGAALSVVGSHAFLIGGETDAGPQVGSLRANVSPKAPFLKLGLFGATVPALSIKGEIGQQLGYMSAMGIGTANFVILILIGVAMSHRRGTQKFFSRLTRGRIKPPPPEEVY